MRLLRVERKPRLVRSFTFGGSGGIHPRQSFRETHGSRYLESVDRDRAEGPLGEPEGGRLLCCPKVVTVRIAMLESACIIQKRRA